MSDLIYSMNTPHSPERSLSTTAHNRSHDTRGQNIGRSGVFRTLAVTALAATVCSASALAGEPPAASAAPQGEQSYSVSLAASAIDIQPAGRCVLGHNPDGRCRGHRASDAGKKAAKAGKNAAKRCAHYGAAGARDKDNEEIGEKVWERAGNAAGGVVSNAAGEKVVKGVKLLKNGKKVFKGKGGKAAKDLILASPGAELGGKYGKKAGKYIGKGAGAIVGCALYVGGE